MLTVKESLRSLLDTKDSFGLRLTKIHKLAAFMALSHVFSSVKVQQISMCYVTSTERSPLGRGTGQRVCLSVANIYKRQKADHLGKMEQFERKKTGVGVSKRGKIVFSLLMNNFQIDLKIIFFNLTLSDIRVLKINVVSSLQKHS